MKSKINSFFVTTWAAVLLISSAGNSLGQAKAPEAPAAAATTATKPVTDPNRKLPFHGKVVSVDKTARTIKISSRTFKVMPTTEITKAEKPATLDDAIPGEVTGGSYKNNNGSLELVKIRLGPKAEDIVKATAASKPATVVRTDKPAVKK